MQQLKSGVAPTICSLFIAGTTAVFAVCACGDCKATAVTNHAGWWRLVSVCAVALWDALHHCTAFVRWLHRVASTLWQALYIALAPF